MMPAPLLMTRENMVNDGVALLASGQSSTMTGTLAGQYVMEGFVELKFSPALRAFLTRMVAIIPSLVVTLVAGESGSEALIKLCSVILSFQLPFALIPLIKFVIFNFHHCLVKIWIKLFIERVNFYNTIFL